MSPRINHVSINARDLQESVDFYVELVGAEPIPTPNFGLPVQWLALGRTQLSESSPEVNSENLLVLVAPVVLIYGVGFFFILLDQINLPMREMRYVVIGLFGVVASLPMLLIFLPPNTIPVM